jgi:hypothetical protein
VPAKAGDPVAGNGGMPDSRFRGNDVKELVSVESAPVQKNAQQ